MGSYSNDLYFSAKRSSKHDLANSPSVAVTTIEFSSEDACLKASRSLESFEKSSSPRKVIDAACLPK